ncbi:hypothetical protein [Spirosoma spitsbergense]|uniref:hypothetical protein n=1 Tax=Spirosoma spitsbergense TaxID=431554 RepID=UPI000373DDF9|nr:hypothetical protein [Spirosoma spitsbergense]
MKTYVLFSFLLVAQVANAFPPDRDYWITPDSLGLTYVQKELVTPMGHACYPG